MTAGLPASAKAPGFAR